MSDARVPVQPEILDACKASEPDALRRRILDPNLPKNEAEHWASAEISRLTARIAELEQRLKPFAVTADTWTVQNAAHRGILLTLSNGERMCAMDASDFIAARTTLEASERGGGK